MKELVQRIKDETTVGFGSIHGPEHWDRVAAFGRLIASREDVDEHLLLRFSYFHDCKRLSDGRDPEDGLRAASYIRTLPRELLSLGNADIERLVIDKYLRIMVGYSIIHTMLSVKSLFRV